MLLYRPVSHGESDVKGLVKTGLCAPVGVWTRESPRVRLIPALGFDAYMSLSLHNVN